MTHNTFILRGRLTHYYTHKHTQTPTVSLLSVYSLIWVIYLKPVSAGRTNCIQEATLHCQRGEEERIEERRSRKTDRWGKKDIRWEERQRVKVRRKGDKEGDRTGEVGGGANVGEKGQRRNQKRGKGNERKAELSLSELAPNFVFNLDLSSARVL